MESYNTLSTNAIHWGDIFEEWKSIEGIKQFLDKKSNEHAEILEYKIEEIIKSKNFYYCRNIKSFKQLLGNNVPIVKPDLGEIDFIILNIELKLIFVAEVKYNRARYEAVGYRNDYSKFVEKYELNLAKKVKWISDNLKVLQAHLKIENQSFNIDILEFEVVCAKSSSGRTMWSSRCSSRSSPVDIA